MGDEDSSQPAFGPQRLQEVQNLGLHRDVQRGSRFVRKQHGGFQHQGAGDGCMRAVFVIFDQENIDNSVMFSFTGDDDRAGQEAGRSAVAGSDRHVKVWRTHSSPWLLPVAEADPRRTLYFKDNA